MPPNNIHNVIILFTEEGFIISQQVGMLCPQRKSIKLQLAKCSCVSTESTTKVTHYDLQSQNANSKNQKEYS